MKTLITFLITLFTLPAFSQDSIMFEGTFKAMTPSVEVQGKTVIDRRSDGMDYITIEDFKLSGGVFPQLNVCGELAEGDFACLSIAEPTNGNHTWLIPYSYKSYKKVIIFDLDLIQNLAIAR